MPKTVCSKNKYDPYETHHPEPECGHRRKIIRCGNDVTDWVETSSQDLTVRDKNGNWRRLWRYTRCRVIEFNRDFRIR